MLVYSVQIYGRADCRALQKSFDALGLYLSWDSSTAFVRFIVTEMIKLGICNSKHLYFFIALPSRMWQIHVLDELIGIS